MGWRTPVFIVSLLLSPPANDHFPHQLKWNIFPQYQWPVPNLHRNIHRREMGEWSDSVLCSKHTSYTDTHAISHLCDVVLQIKLLVTPMVFHPISKNWFHTTITLDWASLQTHAGHIWLVFIIRMDGSLCLSGMKIPR